jgi:hypothetical protein
MPQLLRGKQTVLFLVESFYSVAGRIVVTELRLVQGLVELGSIVPHFSFYDVHCQ